MVEFVDDFVDVFGEELFGGFFFVEFLAEVGEVDFEVLFDFDFVAHEVAVEVDAGFGEGIVVVVVVEFEGVEVELFFVDVHVLVEDCALFFFDFGEELFEFGDFVEVLELLGVLLDFEHPFEAGGVEALRDFGEALAPEGAFVFEGVLDVPVVEFFDFVLFGLFFFELLFGRLVGEVGDVGRYGVEGAEGGVVFGMLFLEFVVYEFFVGEVFEGGEGEVGERDQPFVDAYDVVGLFVAEEFGLEKEFFCFEGLDFFSVLEGEVFGAFFDVFYFHVEDCLFVQVEKFAPRVRVHDLVEGDVVEFVLLVVGE